MKYMIKRFLALMIALMMVLSAMPSAALADSQGSATFKLGQQPSTLGENDGVIYRIKYQVNAGTWLGKTVSDGIVMDPKEYSVDDIIYVGMKTDEVPQKKNSVFTGWKLSGDSYAHGEAFRIADHLDHCQKEAGNSNVMEFTFSAVYNGSSSARVKYSFIDCYYRTESNNQLFCSIPLELSIDAEEYTVDADAVKAEILGNYSESMPANFRYMEAENVRADVSGTEVRRIQVYFEEMNANVSFIAAEGGKLTE